jgi:UDPglucose--hexose-1-phosphate uridylyltransferase
VPELRIDPLSGQRAIIAAERSRRPGGAPTCEPAEPIDVERDPFAPGHEDRTPPELYALRESGPPNSPGWKVRVVPNLYPALEPPLRTPEPARVVRGVGELLQAQPASGAHEVIINAPEAVHSLAQLDAAQVELAVGVWQERMREHAASPYTQLILNERHAAGASLPHTHAQLYALPFVPASVARERERSGAHWTRTMGHDLLSDVVAEEVRREERIVAIDDEAVLLAPWASRLPYQLMLAPRRPAPHFEHAAANGARLLHDALRRLAATLGASPPLNLFVRTAPAGAEHFSWRIDILPRLTHLAGLELSTDLALNIVAPEDAARALREVDPVTG